MIELSGALLAISSLLPPHLDHPPPSLLRRHIAAATLPFIFAPISSSSAADSYNYDAAAASYDSLDGGPLAEALGLKSLRSTATGLCRGKTLEVGVGTGLNLPLYDAKVTASLTAVDLSSGMLREASKAPSRLPVELLQMNAEALKFADASFDAVLDTFSLCVYGDPAAALAEMRRVCKPSGRVVLLEHQRSTANAALGWYQDATAGAASKLGGKGCVYNQRVEELAARAGLEVVKRTEAVAGTVALLETRPKG